MYFLVHRVSNLLGHMGLMYACLVAYTVLFVGYASLVNPWFVLILEVLHGEYYYHHHHRRHHHRRRRHHHHHRRRRRHHHHHHHHLYYY